MCSCVKQPEVHRLKSCVTPLEWTCVIVASSRNGADDVADWQSAAEESRDEAH